MVLITAVGLVAAMGFLSVLDLGGLQHSMELGFERLGADLLVVDRTAKVNLTQALLAVEPDTPALPMEVLEAAAQLPPSILLSPQRAVRGDAQFATSMGLSHGASIPLYGIDPEHDSTVQPWLDEQRGIDFQDGVILPPIAGLEIDSLQANIQTAATWQQAVFPPTSMACFSHLAISTPHSEW